MKRTRESFTATDGTEFYLQCYRPFHVRERGTVTAVIVPAGQCVPEDYNWITTVLCRKGYLVYAMYQRGYGSGIPEINDNGGPQQQQDLREVYAFVKEQPLVDPERIVMIGHSTGASLIQRLGAEENFACGIALAQLSDWLSYARASKDFVPDYYRRAGIKYGDPEEMPHVYMDRSTIHLADKIKMPILAISGDRDFITPFTYAEQMTKALQDAGNTRSEFVVIENAGHFFEHFGFFGDQRTEVAQIIVEWLMKVLPAEE